MSTSTDISRFIFSGALLPVEIEPVGRAYVEEMLGAGAFGFTCRIRDVETHRPYTLKVIRNLYGNDPVVAEQRRAARMLERLQCEAEICLPSEYTVRPYGLRAWDETTYLMLLEYFEGHSLAELLRVGGLDDAAKRQVWEQVLRGVADAHRCNIIHRDLKPDNILVNDRGEARVIDFGFAKDTKLNLTQPGLKFGTLRYMAPETLLEGSSIADARSDIYALGQIFYEMTTGRHFWSQAGWNNLSDFVDFLAQKPMPVATIDTADFVCPFVKEGKKVLERMVRVQPAERYGSLAEVLHDHGFTPPTPPAPLREALLQHPLLLVESGANRNACTVLGLADGEQRALGRFDVAGHESSISRRHVEFERRGHRYYVRDKGSKNGTLLRGQRLAPQAEAEVYHGDRIKLGEVYLRFAFMEAPAEHTRRLENLSTGRRFFQ